MSSMVPSVGCMSITDSGERGNPILAYCHASLASQLCSQKAPVKVHNLLIQSINDFDEWLDLAIEYDIQSNVQTARVPFRKDMLVGEDAENKFYDFFNEVIQSINDDVIVFLPMLDFLRRSMPAYTFNVDVVDGKRVELHACLKKNGDKWLTFCYNRAAIKLAYSSGDMDYYKKMAEQCNVPLSKLKSTARHQPLGRKMAMPKPITKKRRLS